MGGAQPYRSNVERLEALPAFVAFCNQRRPHTALGGLSPSAVVNYVLGDDIKAATEAALTTMATELSVVADADPDIARPLEEAQWARP